MTPVQAVPLSVLYEHDETAWLEAMAALAGQRRYQEMDYTHLSAYLADMARRDRREVFSRLVVLLTHLLKWEYQPEKRSGSWRGTMREQRRELRHLLESRTLQNHAASVLHDAYTEARLQAADETELGAEAFPAARVWNLEELLSEPEGEQTPKHSEPA